MSSRCPHCRKLKTNLPTKVWSTSVGDGVGDYYSHLRPAWQENTIDAADRFGVVKALDADSGKEKWKVNLSEKTGFFSSNNSAQLTGGVAAAGSHIYVGSEKAIVYALNSSDGTIAWQTKWRAKRFPVRLSAMAWC